MYDLTIKILFTVNITVLYERFNFQNILTFESYL